MLLFRQCVHYRVQEVRPKRLRRTQRGYLCAVYLSWSSSCSGSEGLETAAPLKPVCFRRVCEKRRRGVWDCVCLSWSRSQGVEGGVWWIGRQVCSSAHPTVRASHHALHALSQNSLWPWVWRQISHTLANSNKFPLSLHYHHFPACTVLHETAW